MKFEMEINKDYVIRRLIDNGLVFEEIWIKKGTGRYGTVGEAIEVILEEYEYDDNLIEAIDSGDFIDIFREIRRIEEE